MVRPRPPRGERARAGRSPAAQQLRPARSFRVYARGGALRRHADVREALRSLDDAGAGRRPPTCRQTLRLPGMRPAHQSSGSSVVPTMPRRVQVFDAARAGASAPRLLASDAESLGSELVVGGESCGAGSAGRPRRRSSRSPGRGVQLFARVAVERRSQRDLLRRQRRPVGVRAPHRRGRAGRERPWRTTSAAARWASRPGRPIGVAQAAAGSEQVELRPGQERLCSPRRRSPARAGAGPGSPARVPLFASELPVAATSSAPRRTSFVMPAPHGGDGDRGSASERLTTSSPIGAAVHLAAPGSSGAQARPAQALRDDAHDEERRVRRGADDADPVGRARRPARRRSCRGPLPRSRHALRGRRSMTTRRGRCGSPRWPGSMTPSSANSGCSSSMPESTTAIVGYATSS